MVSGNLRVCGGFALSFVGLVLACWACLSPKWGVENTEGNIIEKQLHTWGLWARCVYMGTGLSSCDHYDSLLLNSELELVFARLFVIVGILGGLIGMVMSLIGARCSTIYGSGRAGSSAESGKKKMRLWAGILSLVSGALILIAGIFLTVVIVKQFHASNYSLQINQGRFGRAAELQAGESASLESAVDDVDTEGVKQKESRFGRNNGIGGQSAVSYELGQGIFLAWGAGVLFLLVGALTVSTACGDDDDEYDDSNYAYS